MDPERYPEGTLLFSVGVQIFALVTPGLFSVQFGTCALSRVGWQPEAAALILHACGPLLRWDNMAFTHRQEVDDTEPVAERASNLSTTGVEQLCNFKAPGGDILNHNLSKA